MRSIAASLGWMLFLALAAFALVFYNVAYLPQDNRIARLKEEIDMWTRQVQAINDSLRTADAGPDTVLNVSFLNDVLFAASDSFRLCSQGQTALREYVPRLREALGPIQIIGHTDNSPVPERLRGRCPGNWELGAARAAAVATELIGWGVPARRIQVISAADTRPATPGTSATDRASNRRVQIVVLAR